MKRLVVLAACIVLSCEARVDTPTADDLRLLVKAEALQCNKPLDAKAYVCQVNQPFGAMRDVSCVYDWTTGAHAKNVDAALYFNTGVARYYTTSTAEAGYRGVRKGWDSAFKTTRFEPADELLDLGDEHHAAYFLSESGKRTGNAFIIRRGSIVLRFLSTGFVLDDPQAVRALLEPLVKEAERQD